MGHVRETGTAASVTRRDQITALLAAGGLDACRDALLDEVATGPDGLAWCSDLATSVLAADDLVTAASLADLLARVRRGSARRPARRANGRALAPPVAPSSGRPPSAAKLRHDADQFDLLRRRGLVGPEFDRVIADHRALAARLATGDDAAAPGGDDAARIVDVHDRIVHVADAPRVRTALADTWDPATVEADLLDSRRPLVVVDDVLTPAARDTLVRFCQESTVWSDDPPGDGELVASFFDGFTCALLVQLAGEVRDRFPRLVADRPLTGIGARKHPDVPAAARPPHAEPPGLDVRFWITPTAADGDPHAGDLVVHGEPGRAPTVVPYRGNRAVLFDPGRPHRTDHAAATTGYEHRRVEIILRYAAPTR